MRNSINHTIFSPWIKHQYHYAFGMTVQERQWKASTISYRFKFNGMEGDPEIVGDGNSLDFGARIYSPRLGRWLSTDPLQADYPAFSPFSFVDNNPISFVDPDGRKLIIGKQSRNDVMGYFNELGLGGAFKIKKNGTVKVRNSWARKNSELLEKNSDLNDIHSGLSEVIEHKTKTIAVDVEEGNYDNVKSFPIYETRIVQKPKYAEMPDGNGGTVLKQNGTRDVEKQVLIGYRDIGTKNNSTSKTFYFGKFDRNNIDVKLHRQDIAKSLEGKNGQQAQGSEASTFIHEVLDHGLDFMRDGKDNDDADGTGNEADVKYENKARRTLGINERNGSDHE